MRYAYQILVVVVVFGFTQCVKDPVVPLPTDDTFEPPTPLVLSIPAGFPTITNIPDDNPLTEEGVLLGKKLFYDPILSSDNSLSCAGCHAPDFAFSDNNKLATSQGVDGSFGARNSPALINLLWSNSFFWDGISASLENQALEPVPNPKEMHLPWAEAVVKLKNDLAYPILFQKAFETNTITKELVVKAIAQFERTLISANSNYDKWLANEYTFTASEQNGHDIFFSEKGDCFHCHGTALLTDNLFHNNGLDAFATDKGRGAVTGDSNDNGKFKSPTLRNIALTAPYMHDGRFETLEEVVDFYSSELSFSPTIDPLMKKVSSGGVQLTSQEKTDLIAFLKTLTDSSFINNTAFRP